MHGADLAFVGVRIDNIIVCFADAIRKTAIVQNFGGKGVVYIETRLP
jgi:hypothetical protein